MAKEHRLGYSSKNESGDLIFSNGKRSVAFTTTKDGRHVAVAFKTSDSHYDWLYLNREQSGKLGSHLMTLSKKVD